MHSKDHRLRAVSRAALYGSMLHRHRVKKRHFIAVQALLMALVIASSAVMQVYFDIKPPKVEINQRALGLLNDSRDDAKDYLKQDAKTKGYAFEVPKSAGDSDASEHTGRVADSYSASFGYSSKEGVSVTDTNTQIVFKMTPKFSTSKAHKTEDNRILYTHGATQLVYTLQYNGLKEDIIVPEFQQDSLNYEFELSLPSGVEARLDEQGNIGIYSGDTTLYGQISYGSDEDRAKVDLARENSAKTNLVATIPYPIVKDASGKEHNNLSKFVLGEKHTTQQNSTSGGLTSANLPAEVVAQMASKTRLNTYSLKIESKNLKDLPYPISIDPTFQISSAADFSGVNYEAGTELDSTNNLIKRSNLSGGVAGTWTNTTGTSNLTTARRSHAVATYGGYVYAYSGCNAACSTPTLTVEYAPLNSNGSIGAWTTDPDSDVPVSTNDSAGVAYNGYLYLIGGNTLQTVYYARINANNSIGSWATTSSLAGRAGGIDAVVVNNYMYIAGGCDGVSYCSSVTNTTQYAQIRADGTLGTWTVATASFATARQRTTLTTYNGFVYVYGGSNASGSTVYDTGFYAKPTASGDITAWNSGPTINTARNAANAVINGGYIYLYSGLNSGGTPLTSVEYAQINADGSLGSWKTTTAMNTGRDTFGGVTHNGWIYAISGCNASSCSTITAVNEYTQIKPAGELHDATWSTTTSLLGVRDLAATVATNGYLYVLGGYDGSINRDTSYYAPINADGTVGTWNTTQVLPSARNGLTAVAVRGRMYIMGGTTGSYLATTHYATITASGTLGTWTAATSFTDARTGQTSVTYGDYIYVIGGTNGTRFSSIEYAKVTDTGALATDADGAGPCTTAWCSTTSMNSARDSLTSVVYNGRVYVIGGSDGTSFLNTVEYSTIGSEGGLGSWTGTTGFTTGRYGHTSVMNNGYLYVVGGEASSGKVDTVQYAKINSSGSIDSWSATQSFTTARVYHGSVAYGGYLYVIGGDTGSIQSGVQYQTINNGGNGLAANGTFTNTDNWPNGRFGHASAAYNGYMYISSGRSIQETGCPISCVYTRNINAVIEKGTINTATGNIASWTTNTSVPDGGRYLHQMFAVNGYMFIIGGENNAGAEQDTVYRTTIDASTGNLGAWSTLAVFPQSLSAHGGALVGNTIYITGGVNGSGTVLNNVYYATVDTSGNLSSWTAATSLPAARRHHQTLINNNKLYVIGGMNTDSTADIYNDILVADIAADGSIGAWRHAGTMPSKRHSFVAAASNGYMYIGWGCLAVISITTCASESNLINDIQVASMSAGGGVGSWARTSTDDGSRAQSTSHVIAGRFYTTGGCSLNCGDGLDGLGDVSNRARYIGGLQSIPRVGSFSKLYDLEIGVKPTKLITRGTKQTGAVVGLNYSNNNNAGTSFGTSTSVTDQGFTGANALSIALGTNVSVSRYFFLRYTIDDSLSAVFPDVGNESTITDFDLYYRANSAKRLRGGKTFTNGVNRGLDVQP